MSTFIYILFFFSLACDILCLESYRLTKKPKHKKLPSENLSEKSDPTEPEQTYSERIKNEIVNNGGPLHLIDYKSINERKIKKDSNYFVTVTLPVLAGLLVAFFCLCYVTRPSGSFCRLFDQEEIPSCTATCAGLCHTDPIVNLINYGNESTASLEEIHQKDDSEPAEKKNTSNRQPKDEGRTADEENKKKLEEEEMNNYTFKLESKIDEPNTKTTKHREQTKRERPAPFKVKKQLHNQPSKTIVKDNSKPNSKDKLHKTFLQAKIEKPLTRDGSKLFNKNKSIKAKRSNLQKPIQKSKDTKFVTDVK